MCENLSFKDPGNHVLANYRSTVNCTSGCTSAVLIFGREMTKSLNALLPVVVENTKHSDELLHKAQKHKRYYDRHRCCKESVIKVGDHMRIREFRRQHKLQSDFTNNAFVVKRLVENYAVSLADGHE